MAYRVVRRNDPRYDASSIIVLLEQEEIEVESISYGDNVTIAEIRSPAAAYGVGTAAPVYRAEETELTMYVDAHQSLLERLVILAAGGPVSEMPVTLQVSYAELDPRTGQMMPQLTDTLRGLQYLGTKQSASAGPDLVKRTCRFYTWRIRWHGGIELA